MWRWLEIGGANYGPDRGRYRRDHFDSPEAEADHLCFNTLAVLRTLVEEKGPEGIFYVNDCRHPTVDFAIQTLERNLKSWSISSSVEVQGIVALAGVYPDFPQVDVVSIQHPDEKLAAHQTTASLQALANLAPGHGLEILLWDLGLDQWGHIDWGALRVEQKQVFSRYPYRNGTFRETNSLKTRVFPQ